MPVPPIFAVFLTIVLATAPRPAHAFDFGFVRVPDWMDEYFLYLLPVVAFFWLLTLATKPAGLPFNQLYRVHRRLPFASRWAYRLTALSFIATMVLLFAGMGLQRAAE